MRPAGPAQAARRSRPEENVGVRQQRILEDDESGTEVARGEQSYKQWKEGRSAAVAQASHPTIKVQTGSAGAPFSEPNLARIQIEKVSRADIERPSGRRFGALVHAVLAAVDLGAGADQIGAIAQANARLIDASAAEVDAAVTTVYGTLQYPIMQRAARAKAQDVKHPSSTIARMASSSRA